MSKLPVISGRELVRVLARVGFQFDRQHGSHMILFRDDPPTTLSVPDHRELDRGTLRALLRQAGLGFDEFQRLLRS
jgi:predicted RNA binding protein YcfA (HicA-like mRNA interferase family)